MYVRSYRPTSPQSEPAKSEAESTSIAPEIPEAEEKEILNQKSEAQGEGNAEKGQNSPKRRYKARRKMPDFKCEANADGDSDFADNRTHNPSNAPCEVKSYKDEAFALDLTQGELLVAAIALLLLLEGADDILIFSFFYLLCP